MVVALVAPVAAAADVSDVVAVVVIDFRVVVAAAYLVPKP